MDPVAAQLQSEPSNDIFSLSDQVLSDRLEFIEEIGFGNWGSVWLCRPKPATTQDGAVKPLGQKIAVKLVHRSKTSTTAARVRSLWNEMKIVKSFKSDPHPSIIPFHSFIITPSYALITMSYLPTLIPVEVEESKAREWFHFLLSGVKFLHERGVVHNDIKPANILLSHKNIPVLVDFGFAERYDMLSDTAFHSNLSYGTPEYLSPERARGLPHDTRKSDVWSLGVTFFEILVGRTPFENSDGEQFSSNEDLEKYWARTLRGKWVGNWQFSKAMEKLLQRMVSPNADLRCTAIQAMADSYWLAPKKDAALTMHKRASSYTSTTSMAFEKDMEKLLSMTPSSWRTAKDAKVAAGGKENANMQSPPGLDRSDVFKDSPDANAKPRPALAKSKSQPKVAASSKIAQPRKRAPIPPLADLSPIKASPNPSPAPSPYTQTNAHAHPYAVGNASLNPNTSTQSASAKAKENISSFNRLAATVTAGDGKKRAKGENAPGPNATNTGTTRRPFGTLNANTTNTNLPQRPTSTLLKKPSGHSYGRKVAKVLGERDASFADLNASFVSVDKSMSMDKSRESTNVKDRVKEWEREKERLREMERLEELEKEREEIYKRERKERKERRERKAQEKAKQEEEKMAHEEEQEEEQRQSEEQDIEEEDGRVEDDDDEVDHHMERKNASHLQIRIPGAMSPGRPTLGNNTNLNTNANHKKQSGSNWDWDKENIGSSATSPVLPMFHTGAPLTQVFNITMDTPPPPSAATRLPRGTGKGSFKHSIKASIDKTIEFCKSASLAQVASGRTTPARGFSFDVMRPSTTANGPTSTINSGASKDKDGKEAWEIEFQPDNSLPEISPLPFIKNAAESERVAADSRMDRMTIWMRNVDKVVEDAKQNFASSTTTKELPLPPLPPPLSRSASQSRPSRLPRRVLAASQIFQSDENGNITPMMDQSMLSGNNSAFLSVNELSKGSIDPSTPAVASPQRATRMSEGPSTDGRGSQLQIPEIHTPSRQRRATVSTRSPEPAAKRTSIAIADEDIAESGSPSKRKEKSKSHGNLFQMHIAPISFLEAEMLKTPPPQPTPRLSQVLDRNLFIAPLHSSRDDLLDTSIVDAREPSLDDLTSSPCHVEPYPQRMRSSQEAAVPDTPSRHRIEGVYDRFLMATSGVKRLGKGYQSDNVGPVGSTSHSTTHLGVSQQQPQKGRTFYSTRRPMPPPVSSEDLQRRAASVDELGAMGVYGSVSPPPGANPKDEGGNGTVGLMRKAMKLMAPKSTTSRRLSRIG